MASYTPTEPWIAEVAAVTLLLLLIAGYIMGRSATASARVLAWSLLVLGTITVDRLVAQEPAGVRMLALIIFALTTMKVIVVIEERARGMAPLTLGRWLGFVCTWVGMRPRLFTSTTPGPLRDAGTLLRRGAMHVVAGAILVMLARMAWVSTHSRLLATVLVLPGLSLLIHFGLCNLMAGSWRMRGVACEALFRAPLRSQQLGEFWSRRWNLAFSEMTTIAVYRPLIDRIGRGPALIAGFALSGLLHEMAISVPVRAGYGLPLLYFVMHGALVLVERRLAQAGYPLSGMAGRAWVIFWVVAPLPILFHRAFLAGIVWPLIGVPGGG